MEGFPHRLGHSKAKKIKKKNRELECSNINTARESETQGNKDCAEKITNVGNAGPVAGVSVGNGVVVRSTDGIAVGAWFVIVAESVVEAVTVTSTVQCSYPALAQYPL